MHKYYFMDIGIRNALIFNFNSLRLRDDVGKLWENFLIVERMKRNEYIRRPVNYYFRRTYDQKEIDLVEEGEGRLQGWEFTWSVKPPKPPAEWLTAYFNSSYEVITPENYHEFVGS